MKDFVLNMHVYTASAPVVSLVPGKVTVNASMIAEFGIPQKILKIEAQVLGNCVLKLESGRVKGTLSDIVLDVKVLENYVGVPLTGDEINELANGVIPSLLPTINSKLAEGFPLPKLQHVVFSSYLLTIAERHIQVAANVA